MSKVRAIAFFFVVFLLAFGINAVAQDKSITIMGDSGTTSQSAVLASFLASINDGDAANSSLSVSNVLGSPPGSGFPSGGDDSGSLWFHCYNQNGAVYWFHTADHPDVGAGLDLEGNLAPGGTYTVNLWEILRALHPDREPADRDFVGYCWVVADFDAVAGTYFNTFLTGNQSFQMEPSPGGIPIGDNGGQ